MSQPLLSVLIASVPRRIPMPFSALFTKLCHQAEGWPVEVLGFADNRRRTLGEKMNDLLALARGRYTVFVDDDDDVEAFFISYIVKTIMQNPEVDVINYRIRVSLPDGDGYVYPALENPNEEFGYDKITLRKPLQTSVWRAALSKAAKWPSGQYNVDAAWGAQLWAVAKTQAYIPETLYHYRRTTTPTEAH